MGDHVFTYIDNLVEKNIYDFFFLMPMKIETSEFETYADLSLKYYEGYTLKIFKQMVLNKTHEVDIFKYKYFRKDQNKVLNFIDKIDRKIKSEK